MAKGVRSELVVVGFSPASGNGLNSALGSDKLGIRCLCTPKAGPWLGDKWGDEGVGAEVATGNTFAQ